MNLMTDVDFQSLVLYCESYDRWRGCLDRITDTGYVTETDKGNLIQHPMLGVMNKAHDQMLKILVEFGMTPSSRTRVQRQGGKAGEWKI